MTSALRKLVGLGQRGWRDLIRAQSALLRARHRLQREPIASLAIREQIDPAQADGPDSRARELALAIGRVSEHGLFRPSCLVRALALRELLVTNGIRGASIRIGVKRLGGELQAHAWVCLGRVLLGEDDLEHVASFTEVDDIRASLF